MKQPKSESLSTQVASWSVKTADRFLHDGNHRAPQTWLLLQTSDCLVPQKLNCFRSFQLFAVSEKKNDGAMKARCVSENW